jgi:hypothetical protein
MKAGDTFRIPQPGTSLDSHLWVVISDPAQDANAILIVNFTTVRADSDTACVLAAGEHPFVKHDTCVNYRGAKVVSEASIQTLMSAGHVQPHAAVAAAILKRIQEGAANSTRMSLDHAEILSKQGLIDC